MYKPFTKKLLANLLIISSMCVGTSTFAAKLDLEKEVDIDSDRLAADLKNKIVTYLDNVTISQGSLSIKADLVQVYSEVKTDNKTYVAKGKPASFEQTLDDGSLITLQAEEITYDPASFLVTISGNAILKQAGSEVSSSKIIYNIQTEQLNAESGPDDQKVSTVLKPKAKDKK